MLEKIYQRITIRKVIQAITSKAMICYPTIQCEILPPDLDEGAQDPFPLAEGEDDTALWEECHEGEEDNEQFEYFYVEDPATLTVIKKKKRIALVADGD